ncbi:hypothetical protein D3C81_1388500 [compost metagenome]
MLADEAACRQRTGAADDFGCGFRGHEDKARPGDDGLERLHGIEAGAVVQPDIEQHDIGAQPLLQARQGFAGTAGGVYRNIRHDFGKECRGA